MRPPTTTVRVKIIQETPRALCVAPDGDRERAAWLRPHEIERVGEPDGEGFVDLELSLALAMLRGFVDYGLETKGRSL